MRIVTEPGVAGGCEQGRDCVQALFLFGKKRGSIFGIIVLQHDGAGAGLQTPALHLITWRSAPGCWGHYGHWCSLLAAGPFWQTDKQESISAPYFIDRGIIVIIFPSSVSVSLFKVLFYLFINFGQRMPPSGLDKTNVWRQEGILYWPNGHPTFCHAAAALGPSPALEMHSVQRARPGGWRPGEKQDIVFHNYFMRDPASTSNQPEIVGTWGPRPSRDMREKGEKWRGKKWNPET